MDNDKNSPQLNNYWRDKYHKLHESFMWCLAGSSLICTTIGYAIGNSYGYKSPEKNNVNVRNKAENNIDILKSENQNSKNFLKKNFIYKHETHDWPLIIQNKLQ